MTHPENLIPSTSAQATYLVHAVTTVVRRWLGSEPMLVTLPLVHEQVRTLGTWTRGASPTEVALVDDAIVAVLDAHDDYERLALTSPMEVGGSWCMTVWEHVMPPETTTADEFLRELMPA